MCDPDLTTISNRVGRERHKYACSQGSQISKWDVERWGPYLNICPRDKDPIMSPEVLDLIDKCGCIVIPPQTTLRELPTFLTHNDPVVREFARERYEALGGDMHKLGELDNLLEERFEEENE